MIRLTAGLAFLGALMIFSALAVNVTVDWYAKRRPFWPHLPLLAKVRRLSDAALIAGLWVALGAFALTFFTVALPEVLRALGLGGVL